MPARRLTTTQRGYGTDHNKARQYALARLHDGDPCAECRRLGRHHPMYRANAALLDLSHNVARTGYIGLSYRRCNRSEGATRGNRQRGKAQQVTRYSRQW